MGKHPGHPGRPGHPHRHPRTVYALLDDYGYANEYWQRAQLFCEPYYPANGIRPFNPCLTPVKAKAALRR
jgi:hypothetical protein